MKGPAMTFSRFHDFGELYRAALAETDEKKKDALLHEVARIIQNGESAAPKGVSYRAKAA
jgi:hypothetical protein